MGIAYTEIQESPTTEANFCFKDLETINGFYKLTPTQRKIIKMSLEISERAFRKTDPASAAAIGKNPLNPFSAEPEVLSEEILYDPWSGYKFDPSDRKYRESQELIANQYCHTAILALENQQLSTNIDSEKLSVDQYFFKAKYCNLYLVEQGRDETQDDKLEFIKSKIIKFGFPCVVLISGYAKTDVPEYNPGEDAVKHSFLAIGQDSQGNILCWDKEGKGLPYRIVKIDDEYNGPELHYTFSFWGIRKLREK